MKRKYKMSTGVTVDSDDVQEFAYSAMAAVHSLEEVCEGLEVQQIPVSAAERRGLAKVLIKILDRTRPDIAPKVEQAVMAEE